NRDDFPIVAAGEVTERSVTDQPRRTRDKNLPLASHRHPPIFAKETSAQRREGHQIIVPPLLRMPAAGPTLHPIAGISDRGSVAPPRAAWCGVPRCIRGRCERCARV